MVSGIQVWLSWTTLCIGSMDRALSFSKNGTFPTVGLDLVASSECANRGHGHVRH